MELSRKISSDELKTLEHLIEISRVKISDDWAEGLTVREMNDGGMGSIILIPKGAKSNRKFGKQISEFQYKDVDGIDVLVSLNLDSEGMLYELDFWKMDYSELQKYPDLDNIEL